MQRLHYGTATCPILAPPLTDTPNVFYKLNECSCGRLDADLIKCCQVGRFNNVALAGGGARGPRRESREAGE